MCSRKGNHSQCTLRIFVIWHLTVNTETLQRSLSDTVLSVVCEIRNTLQHTSFLLCNETGLYLDTFKNCILALSLLAVAKLMFDKAFKLAVFHELVAQNGCLLRDLIVTTPVHFVDPSIPPKDAPPGKGMLLLWRQSLNERLLFQKHGV